MEIGKEIVHLTEHEQRATGLPETLPLESALDCVETLRKNRIPLLRDVVLAMQEEDSSPTGQELIQGYHAHFSASMVAIGLAQAVADRQEPRL